MQKEKQQRGVSQFKEHWPSETPLAVSMSVCGAYPGF